MLSYAVMRIGRKNSKHAIKMRAHRHQSLHKGSKTGPEGMTCPICAAHYWGKWNKQDARDKADIKHMRGEE